METVQGYVILKAATFETGHGFALGHNPGAPSPFVTWQFTEGENGHRDYYWGRYGTSQAWAQRDFDRRVDDYHTHRRIASIFIIRTSHCHTRVKSLTFGPQAEIICRSIDTQFLNTQFLRQVLRQCVAQSDVTDAEVAGLYQIEV